MLDETRLTGPGAERAEAHGLADLTLRRRGQIDALLGGFLERMPGPPVSHVLRVMTAELVFSDRAAHAAVDMAVRQVKASRSARFASLVNAIGRRMARDGAAAAAEQDAGRLNMPDWLDTALAADWGRAAADAIATAHLTQAPTDLTLRAPADGPALAEETGGTLLPTGSLRLAGRPQITALPGYAAGAWWAQDAAAALPAAMLGPVAGRRVLDLCAAPGGKTLQLAAAGAEVTALDSSDHRMARLADNLTRTGLAARAIVADALKWEPDAPFDAVLLDAPCSATGTLRRHPDLAHRLDPGAVPALVALQATLLDRAWGWVRPGGRLVIATCSLLRAEGEDLADAFCARTPDAALHHADDPALGAFLDDRGRLRTRPDQWADRGGLDGFFAAAFDRA